MNKDTDNGINLLQPRLFNVQELMDADHAYPLSLLSLLSSIEDTSINKVTIQARSVVWSYQNLNHPQSSDQLRINIKSRNLK